MLDAGQWLVVVLVFVGVPLLSRPAVLRACGRLVERLDQWTKARAARKFPVDPEQEALWLWSKRCRLCAARDRIARLLVWDEGMSATRQLGNRIAYDQVLEELSRIPDVFPGGAPRPVLEWGTEPERTPRRRRPDRSRDDEESSFPAWTGTSPVRSLPGQVEVLEIGLRRRR